MKIHKLLGKKARKNGRRITACGLQTSETNYPFNELIKSSFLWEKVECKSCIKCYFEVDNVLIRKLKRNII